MCVHAEMKQLVFNEYLLLVFYTVVLLLSKVKPLITLQLIGQQAS